MDFAQRLKTAMKYRNKTQTDIATNCAIDKGNLSHCLKGDWTPKQSTIIKIANYLNVSPAYLLGLSNDMFPQIIQVNPDDMLSDDGNIKQSLLNEIMFECSKKDIEQLQRLVQVVKII